jgi:putative ABC transport system ATP-binding protein
MSEPLVRCRGVVRTYGKGDAAVRALRGVDADIEAGRLVALVGASGSGKSTLLHLLGAIDRPDAGSITIESREIARFDDREASRFRRDAVGFVFQFFNLVPTLSALDNVALPARLAGVAPAAAREASRSLLSRVGLQGREDARPDQLSGGQAQRVAVARALVNSPRLVLADEPTGNLDRATGTAILDLLQEIVAERGVTLVMATHADDAIARAHRVLRLVDGLVAEP